MQICLSVSDFHVKVIYKFEIFISYYDTIFIIFSYTVKK
jgi:hypothetical protein